MKTILSIGTTFIIGALAGGLLTPAIQAQFRSTKTTNLLTTDLAGWCDGKEITIDIIEPSPGTSGRHYHPGHSFTWVIDGSETYEMDGKAPKTVKAGDLLHEEPMQAHTVGNQFPAKLLVMRLSEKGKPTTVRLP